MKKWIGKTGIFLLSTSIVLSGCGRKKAEDGTEEQSTEIFVTVDDPSRHTIVQNGEFIGMLVPEEQTVIVPKMSGEVTNTYFEVGDVVERGDLLFTMDDSAAKLQLQNAEATYQSAQAGAAQQLGGLELQMAQAQNSLESARSGVQSAENGIYSAIDGFDSVKKQREDLEGNLSDVERARNDAEEYYRTLSALSGRLNALRGKIDQFNQTEDVQTKIGLASEIAAMLGTDTAGIGLSSGSIEDISGSTQIDSTVCTVKFERENLTSMGLTIAGLDSAMTSAKSAFDTASSSYTQMKGSIGTLESQEDSLERSKTSAYIGYDQAVSGEALAQKNYEYTRDYTVPGTTVTVQSQLIQAEIAVKTAKMQLDYTQVRTPVSGKIESIHVDQYGMAQAGSPAYVITNTNAVMANFKVSDTVKEHLSVEQKIIVEKGQKTYSGYITEIGENVDAQSGLFLVKAMVEGDTSSLYSGASIKLVMETDKAENAITLPIGYIYYEGGSPFVYCMENGKAIKTYIETGLFNDEVMEVVSGLREDSKVISSWSPQLRDGAEVFTEKEEMFNNVLPKAGEAEVILARQEDKGYE